MSRYVFDIETDGFLEDMTVVHCLAIKDIDTGVVTSYREPNAGYRANTFLKDSYDRLSVGIERLQAAEEIIGHNIIAFDIPALNKVRPGLGFKPRGKVTDTMIWAQVVSPKDWLRDGDFARDRNDFPGSLIGSYGLKAFGLRMGNHKGDFEGPWDVWTQEMHDYCVQDCEVTYDLYKVLEEKGRPQPAFDIEHQVRTIVARQMQRGFAFDEPKAVELLNILTQRKQELTRELTTVFKPRYIRDGGEKASIKVPTGKAVSISWTGEDGTKRKVGRVPGAKYQKVKLTEFNPASRQHIELWLRRDFGWEPVEFTPSGQAKVDDEVIGQLPWEEAKPLAEYLMIDKRLGQLANGDQAWLKKVRNGRIHGSVNTVGTPTARMTHSDPNLAQVVSIHDRKTGGVMPYGRECRELFKAGDGYVLVGCDADGLELRCLAGRMALYDKGEYVKTVLEGDKDLGTDMHSVNMRALGFDGRDPAKTWFYAFIYGAGDGKLGKIAGGDVKRGKADRARFLANLPALGAIIKAAKAAAKRGHLWSLDGRKIPVRSQHSALNTLLQSDGAIIMKKALCILDDDLQAAGYVPGDDYEFVANVHDEWQIEARKGIADEIGTRAAASIRHAGEFFEYGCPLSGDFEVGSSWADTH